MKRALAITFVALAPALLFGCPKKSDQAAAPAPSAAPVVSSVAVADSATPAASASSDLAPLDSVVIPTAPPPVVTATPAAVASTPAPEDFEDKAESAITAANAEQVLSTLDKEIQ